MFRQSMLLDGHLARRSGRSFLCRINGVLSAGDLPVELQATGQPNATTWVVPALAQAALFSTTVAIRLVSGGEELAESYLYDDQGLRIKKYRKNDASPIDACVCRAERSRNYHYFLSVIAV